MIRSIIRRTMKAALRRPEEVMCRGPQAHRIPSPGVKNRFKTPVKTMMNNTGFKPFTRARRPTLDTRTQTASTRTIRP